MPSFGTLKADTLTHSTAGSVDTNYVVNGSAKAWIDYQTAATYVNNDSFNVASLSDDGTGLATVNITNDMASSNYSLPQGTRGGLAGGTKVFQNNAKAAGSFSLYTTSKDGNPGDIENTYATIFGDLA